MHRDPSLTGTESAALELEAVARDPNEGRRALRILVVEDEAVVAIDLESRLQAMGHEVVGIADNMAEARAIFTETLPDIVLLDIRLRRNEDGVEVAKALRAHADRPVVFITAYNDPATVRRATGAGAHGYLIKPFDDRMLAVTLAIALERHAAERTLSVYRAALQSASVGVLIVTRRGSAPRIAYANEEFLRLTGRGREEVQGAVLGEILGADAEAGRALEDAVAQRRSLRREMPCARSQGPAMWASVVVSPVAGADGTEATSLLFVLDITREREARQALSAAQRSELAGRLAAAVAHDFNNVLAAIGSFAELALEAESLESCREDLREVLRASWTGGRLMQKLLQVARPVRAEQGAAADVVQVLASARPTLERLVGAGVALQVRLDARPLVVGLGVTSLEQVVFNLVTNARDAMPGGGVLRIEAEPVPNASPTHARLRFSDTGMGMDAAVLGRIFDPFFTTKPQGMGTGIGLSTTRALVESVGGTIRARSEAAIGTDFEIELPLVHARPEAPEENEELGALLRRARGEPCALVLPPGPVRRAYARALELVGLGVIEASDLASLEGATPAALAVAVVDVSGVAPRDPHEATLSRLRAMLPGTPLLVVGGLDHECPAGRVRVLRQPCSTAHLARAVLDELSAPAASANPSSISNLPPRPPDEDSTAPPPARSPVPEDSTQAPGAGRIPRLRKAMYRAQLPTELLADLGATADRFERSLETLSVRYLPVVSLAEGAVAGWRVSVRSEGPFAESAALEAAALALEGLARLGSRVRARVARDCASLPADGTRIFVPLHPLDLATRALDEDPSLATHARRVVLEVSERTQWLPAREVEARLNELRVGGYAIALRDLGEGFGSLDWLEALRPEFACLDGSLTRGLDRHEARRQVVESLARICTRSRTRLIATAVEHPAEAAALRALGCALAQGPLYGPSRDAWREGA